MDKQYEIMVVIEVAIRRYLDTMRGAHAFGSNADVAVITRDAMRIIPGQGGEGIMVQVSYHQAGEGQ